ncbi:MAG TPA: trypsin-like peptidase domain-containing protein [Allosphingosinicella sp.]|nr:trypsin-like peptidase domain-containing protein [Allosphingosinicella sp.]
MKQQAERSGGPGPEPGAGTAALLLMLAMLISAFLGAAAFWWLSGRSADRPVAELPAPVPVTAVPLSRLTLSPLVERAAPAVVNIAVLQPSPLEQNPLLRDPYFRHFFRVPDEALAPRLSAGSGVIVDAGRGLVLTNHHVVDNARAIEVTIGERRVEARLLGSDPGTDIAVLQIPARGLSQLPLGDSSRLEVGDYVVAIGNPFEIGQTVTAGIVSALGRGRRGSGPTYVQTDAPINPGNSGGPLISMRGEVIGINSAIIGPGEGNVGIGLAVPSNTARRVMEIVVERSGAAPGAAR